MKLHDRLTLSWLMLKFFLDALVIIHLWSEGLLLLVLSWLLVKFVIDAVVIAHLWRRFHRLKGYEDAVSG